MQILIMVLVSGLVLGSIYGLIALGYSLIYKASGLMNFSQGDTLTLGVFLGYTFYGILGLPYWAAIILTAICAFVIGILMERFVIRKLQDRHVQAIYIVLATIAISYIMQNSVQTIWGTKMLNYKSVFGILGIKIFGVTLQPESLLCVGVALLCMLILHFFMKHTLFGVSMRAAAMDAKAAQACGINTSLTTAVTWAVSAALAALAGVLLGPIYGVYISLGASIGRKGFASAVMGGYGNMYGAMIGGLLLGVLEIAATTYISSVYKDMISYGLLLIFLFVKPTGIFNERAITE